MMMQALRSKGGKILAAFFALAFLGWMVLQVGLDVSGRGRGSANEIGRVNGRSITIAEFNQAYQNLYDQARRGRTGQLSADEQAELREQTWKQLVDQALIENEIARRHIGVSDDEITRAALLSPPPELMQNELFQTNGQFDPGKYQQFLSGPTASPELFARLEAYYRGELPRAKLYQQVAAGAWVSDMDLWRAFRDRADSVTVEYAVLDLSRLAPTDAPVSDDEVKKYYDEHKDEFKRSATARFDVAYIPLTLTAADTAATLAHAQALRAEIMGGADFAEVAKRESKDPGSKDNGGSLGTFHKGQMVPAFDQAVFSLPVGQVSEPVQTQYGFHLIKVDSRTGDQATARHILLPIEKSDSAMNVLATRADSVHKLAPSMGLEKAARLVGATYLPGVTVSAAGSFVPGVGSAREALDWAADQASADDAPKNPVSDAFQSQGALYVVRLASYTPHGTLSLAEATPQIRRTLIVEKKKEQAKQAGQRMVQEVRAGKTLQQVAAEHGLTFGTAGPFTRMDPQPVFGQGNAVIGAAFGTPVGQVSQPVESTAGLFLIRPVQRKEASRAEFERQKDQLRTYMAYQVQQEQIARWLDGLRHSAKIQDYRDQVFKGRAS